MTWFATLEVALQLARLILLRGVLVAGKQGAEGSKREANLVGVKSGTILLFEMQTFSTTFLLYAVILCCTLFLWNSSGFL
jgi:hypothetical protein